CIRDQLRMQLVLDLKLQPSSAENGNGRMRTNEWHIERRASFEIELTSIDVFCPKQPLRTVLMKMYKRSIENVAGFGFEKACRKLFGLCDLSGSSLGSSPDDNSSNGIKLDEMEYGSSGLLMAIHYRADPYTDEVFAQIALLPEQSQDENAVEKEPPLAPR
ncbi:hypothetical protein HN51_028558, partial [Arachis hypogaea]